MASRSKARPPFLFKGVFICLFSITRSMDDVDIQLCRLLLMNSRQPLRELAVALGLSVQAVHKRIRELESIGAIKRYNVCLTDEFIGAMKCSIRGSTGLGSYNELVSVLERDDRTLFLFFCGMSEVFIVGLLHELDELESYLEFLKREARIADPRIAFAGAMRFSEKGARPRPRDRPDLTPLDYRIVHALMDDSRKPITDLAQALKVSAKTVKKHLDRMIADGVLEFSLDFFPIETSGSTVFQFVELRPEVDRRAFMADVVRRHGRYIMIIQAFNDLPNTFVISLWTPTQRVVNDIEEELSKDPSVKSVHTNLIQKGAVFRTWRERLVAQRAKGR